METIGFSELFHLFFNINLSRELTPVRVGINKFVMRIKGLMFEEMNLKGNNIVDFNVSTTSEAINHINHSGEVNIEMVGSN